MMQWVLIVLDFIVDRPSMRELMLVVLLTIIITVVLYYFGY